MSNKGNTKKEMQQRFADMGIPTPVKPITNPKSAPKNSELASKMDQIRNGSLAGNFKQFISKSEKTSSMPTNIPVPKVGKNPNEKTKDAPALSSFTPKSSSEASMLENMMYGTGPTTSSAPSTSADVSDFGPQNVDIRSRLQQRLAQKQDEVNDDSHFAQPTQVHGILENQLTDAELTDKITEVAKKVSKDMIKNVIMELSKSKGGLIVESKSVKKAEIVARNKVKIDGKVYKLTLDK
jgi:hypothetical protein